MATRRRFRRQSRHLKKRRSHKYKKYKKSRRNYYNMRGGAPIDILSMFIEAMKKKNRFRFYVAPQKFLSLDTGVLYIDGGSVSTMQLSILTDGSGILSIDALNVAPLETQPYPINLERNIKEITNYNITEAKKNEILEMIGYSEA